MTKIDIFSGFLGAGKTTLIKKRGFFPSVGSKVIQKPCSAGARTWRNILYRLQVWNLSPIGGQILRVADCINLSESPEGVFRQSEPRRRKSGGADVQAMGISRI